MLKCLYDRVQCLGTSLTRPLRSSVKTLKPGLKSAQLRSLQPRPIPLLVYGRYYTCCKREALCWSLTDNIVLKKNPFSP